jgi:uncharacterized protein (DUF1499 family)
MNIVYFLPALFLLLIIGSIIKNQKTPPTIGVKNGQFAPMPRTPNAVSSQSETEATRVDPIPFKQSGLKESKKAILQILDTFKDIDIIKEEKNYIHAVSTTVTLHFHDDLEFFFDERIRAIHFRSASRVGYSDLGLNRKRYNQLLSAYMASDN